MIMIDKQIVYQHPEFEIKKFKIVEAISVDLPCSVKYDESIVANFTTKDKAERWIRFMKGETTINKKARKNKMSEDNRILTFVSPRFDDWIIDLNNTVTEIIQKSNIYEWSPDFGYGEPYDRSGVISKEYPMTKKLILSKMEMNSVVVDIS